MPRHIPVLLLLAFSLFAHEARSQVTIIPQPDRIETGQGSFALNRDVRVVAPADRRAQEITAFLRAGIGKQSGIALRLGAAASQPRIE